MKAPIAERTFDRRDEGAPIIVRIYAPEKSDEWSGWSARVEIVGLPETFQEEASGVDSFQALYLALCRACARLEKLESILTFRESADANLPLILPWISGPALKADVQQFARDKILTYLDSLPPASSETP
jgi:hypothetical protein